jgi:hypothetical protein
MSGFALDGWALLGVLFIVLALGILGGVALGYYTAATDLRREQGKAWDRGASDMQSAIRKVWIPPTTLVAEVRNPYRKALAPAPKHHVIPTPPPRLFDQDEPTTAAIAIELRGDDR